MCLKILFSRENLLKEAIAMYKLFLKSILMLAVPAVALAQGVLIPPSNITFQMPSITIPRDARAGTVLDKVYDLSRVEVKDVDCSFLQSTQVFGTPATGISKVYKTNVPGVGVKFSITKGWSGAYYAAPDSATSNPHAPTSSAQQYRKVEYVAIDKIEAGTIVEAPYMVVTYSGSCFPTVSYRADIQGGVSVIKPHTCSLLTSRVNVNLPDVKASSLRNAGSTVGDTGFSIDLSCDKGSNVYISLTDKNNVSNRGGVLSLDKASTASGVGIEILMNQKPVKFGADSSVAGAVNQMLVGPSTPSLTSIPFTARYISLGKTASGTVSAIATFTMSYQ